MNEELSIAAKFRTNKEWITLHIILNKEVEDDKKWEHNIYWLEIISEGGMKGSESSMNLTRLVITNRVNKNTNINKIYKWKCKLNVTMVCGDKQLQCDEIHSYISARFRVGGGNPTFPIAILGIWGGNGKNQKNLKDHC